MLTPSRSWLRGLTVGLALGAVVGAATVSRGTSGRGDATLEARVTALETLTQNLRRVEGSLNDLTGPHLIIEGANVHVRSGSGNTEDEGFDAGSLTGLGNLVVGYNEVPAENDVPPGQRAGSHNLIIGPLHRYTRVGGLLAGRANAVTGDFATVSGGRGNLASGFAASVSGGQTNTASGDRASVTGGFQNEASGNVSSVTGGVNNEAAGAQATVGGGSDTNAPNTSCWIAGIYNAGC